MIETIKNWLCKPKRTQKKNTRWKYFSVTLTNWWLEKKLVVNKSELRVVRMICDSVSVDREVQEISYHNGVKARKGLNSKGETL